MIIWLPVLVPGLTDIGEWLVSKVGLGFINGNSPIPLVRTRLVKDAAGYVPIPFYFYERLSNAKDATDESVGFLLDNVTENIDLTYPESSTTGIQGSEKPPVVTIRNTIEVSFRVKTGSTLISVFRMLLKRGLTSYDMAKYIRFSFYWREYVITTAKLVDYNEEPLTGTDMVLLRLKLETFQESEAATQVEASKIEGVVYITGG